MQPHLSAFDSLGILGTKGVLQHYRYRIGFIPLPQDVLLPNWKVYHRSHLVGWGQHPIDFTVDKARWCFSVVLESDGYRGTGVGQIDAKYVVLGRRRLSGAERLVDLISFNPGIDVSPLQNRDDAGGLTRGERGPCGGDQCQKQKDRSSEVEACALERQPQTFLCRIRDPRRLFDTLLFETVLFGALGTFLCLRQAFVGVGYSRNLLWGALATLSFVVTFKLFELLIFGNLRWVGL